MTAETSRPVWVTPLGDNTWRVLVRVQPGAKRSEIMGESDGRLRIRLMAPAVENKGNKALVAFIADTLKLRPNQVKLVSGDKARQKTVVISAPEPSWGALCPPASQ